MTPGTDTERSLIFISFRSSGAGSYAAVYLDEVLPRVFGRERVFRSSRSIAAGADYRKVLTEALRRTRVLLVLIGDDWASVPGEDGKPLLHRDDDWVRREVGTALREKVPVIPVLLTGARLPGADRLPPDLAALADRQTVHLRHRHIDPDAGHLVRQIKRTAPDLVDGPRAEPRTSRIHRRQNEPEGIELLAAVSAAHTRVRRVETARTAVSLAVAGLGAASCLLPLPTAPVALVSAAWAIGMAVGVIPWARRRTRQASVLQEMFDTDLFELPWNTAIVGMPVPGHEVRLLADSFAGDSRESRLRDWYVDTRGLPYPVDVFVCQEQNLGWDIRLRRRWARVLLALAGGWLLLGLAAARLAELSAVQIALHWYLPALGAVLLAVEGYRSHVEISDERERVLALVQAELERASGTPPSRGELERMTRLAREVQDVVFATRSQSIRVPDWFYARFRDADERSYERAADRLRRRLGR